jgi:hypothetical protein
VLPSRFRQILKKIVDTKKEMGKTMRLSAFAMVEAKYAAGDFVPTVFDAVQTVRPHLLSTCVDKGFWGERFDYLKSRLAHWSRCCNLEEQNPKTDSTSWIGSYFLPIRGTVLLVLKGNLS